MPTPSQPFKEPAYMTAAGGIVWTHKIVLVGGANQNNNGSQNPTSGQTFPTGR